MTHYPYSGMIPNLVIDRHIGSASYERVIDLCAKEYGIKPCDIHRQTRIRSVVEPRMIAAYLMRFELGMKLPDISTVFHQHHATTINACRTVRNLMDTEDEVQRRVMRIQQQL